VIVRLFSVYGPELRKQLLWETCSRLSQNVPTLVLGGTGNEVRDWTDVRDVVRLLARLGDLSFDDRCQILNGGSGVGMRVADVANMLVKTFGCETSITYSGVARRGDPYRLLADDSGLRRIGFEWRIPMDRGIADYVAWFKGTAHE
jgi:UDP-glucose 4-epimerase